MNLFRWLRSLSSPKGDLMPIFARQSAFLVQSSSALDKMTRSSDHLEWQRLEKEIKSCEVQGDALLTEFQEQILGRLIGAVNRVELQTVAMSMDDFLDVIKDASKAVLIYHPKKIDQALQELAQIVKDGAEAVRDLVPMLWDIKHKFSGILLQCDRITELEHSADELYEEYVGYIFTNEPDLREMTKYKNLAELFEKATDSGKRIADNVRRMLLKYHME